MRTGICILAPRRRSSCQCRSCSRPGSWNASDIEALWFIIHIAVFALFLGRLNLPPYPFFLGLGVVFIESSLSLVFSNRLEVRSRSCAIVTVARRTGRVAASVIAITFWVGAPRRARSIGGYLRRARVVARGQSWYVVSRRPDYGRRAGGRGRVSRMLGRKLYGRGRIATRVARIYE